MLDYVCDLLGKRIRIEARRKCEKREKVIFRGFRERRALEIAAHDCRQGLCSVGELELLLVQHVAGGSQKGGVGLKDLMYEECANGFDPLDEVQLVEAGGEHLVVEGQDLLGILVLLGKNRDP